MSSKNGLFREDIESGTSKRRQARMEGTSWSTYHYTVYTWIGQMVSPLPPLPPPPGPQGKNYNQFPLRNLQPVLGAHWGPSKEYKSRRIKLHMGGASIKISEIASYLLAHTYKSTAISKLLYSSNRYQKSSPMTSSYCPAKKEGGQEGYQLILSAFLHNCRYFFEHLKGFLVLKISKNRFQR